MQAIVLAGGFGTRLRARVADVPKPMAPIAARPFLEYLLDRLVDAGCTRTVLATGYLHGVIEAHFGASYRGMAVAYSHESQPLGTGGAVLQALRGLDDAPALVLNGDTWMGLDLPAFAAWAQAATGQPAVVLRRVDDVARFGSVVLDGERVVRFGEKTGHGAGLINAGIYWLQRRTLEALQLPEVFSLEADAFMPHLDTLGLRGFVAEGEFIDIGVPEEFDRAQTAIPAWAAAQR